MLLDKIVMRHFRCMREAQFRLSPGTTLFWGNNGTGKTSILEGLSWISWGKSLRSASSKDCIPLEGSADMVSQIDLHFDEGTHLVFRAHATGKSLSKNGARVTRYKDILESFRFICIADDEVAVMRGYPEVRRSFIDYAALLLDPQGAEILKQYRHISAQKQALLTQSPADISALAIWHEQLEQVSQAVCALRACTLRELSEEMRNIQEKIPELPLLHITLAHQSPPPTFQLLQKEVMRKRLLWGAHLDDIAFVYEGMTARTHISRGQQKVLIAASKVALARLSMRRYPHVGHLFAFDDIRADLDPQRREHLYHLLDLVPCQVLVTAPEIDPSLRSYMGKRALNFLYELTDEKAS